MKKLILLTMILPSVVAFSTCSRVPKNKTMIKKESYGTYTGKEVFLFTLTNRDGNVVKLSNFGARITWIEVPDKTGKKENITFGYDTSVGMIKGDPFFGSVVGRYANRIAKGRFTLDGKEYTLTVNNGPNSLHGGPGGWHSLVWDYQLVEKSEFPSVRFTLHSPDMEEGYPGNMHNEILYTWTDKNELILEYKCTTDKKTILNVTNHAYFNLHGSGNGDILDHELVINAASIVAVDSTLIPTGELRPVAGTPMDFSTPDVIGKRINEDYDQLKYGNGYDHTYILDGRNEIDAAVYDPANGRHMEMITDQPGVQFYTGNFLNGSKIGYNGKPYTFRSGLCLESGHFADSPNHPDFPTTVLNPGETFISKTIYRFSVK